MYNLTKIARVTFEYSFYKPINIQPKWYNLNYNNIESNIQFMARFNESNAIFYPSLGFSYNTFSAYFTGRNDSRNLALSYKPNTTVSINWIG
jgi:hypothetical protein